MYSCNRIATFITVIITYDIYLSYISILFKIRIFNLFKYVKNMSLISLILQHKLIYGWRVISMCENLGTRVFFPSWRILHDANNAPRR
jgi:hypothetical protein